MATETRPSAQQLSELIDALTEASDLSTQGKEQASETGLRCLERLRQMQVFAFTFVKNSDL